MFGAVDTFEIKWRFIPSKDIWGMIHLIHIHWIKIFGISEVVVLAPVLDHGEKLTYV